jgi:MerR family transcriptional regulator, mercuric resistance operon regulatory protein
VRTNSALAEFGILRLQGSDRICSKGIAGWRAGAQPDAPRRKELTRGELAAQTGCNIETIRYYEQIGLLPPPPRSQGGHRLYGDDLRKRLGFIRRSRDLGFTLDETRELLRLVDGGNYTCAQVEALARDHVREIERKISDLNKVKRALEKIASQCDGGTVPLCPIIGALFDPRTRFPVRNTHA